MEKDVISKIRYLTTENSSIESYVLGAKYLNNKDLEKIFKAIQVIQNDEGCLPHWLKDYRYEQVKKMMQYAKETLSPEQFENFRKSF